ncbi:hypothetical protein [Teredinibacter sp. KSP-S5-2]|uniref:hypothetical protein n=1 Tax=Teredinibacter sp. KSP-S5-2 TaxID=3034506 RepID=UPI0029349EE6|nr:hypothetical protein [Teredinibacter sp. KSP-S5-2]WNO10498.1 hypothetical protein P5V12_04865 [Teredinibacter sp. KSP-S5-2]
MEPMVAAGAYATVVGLICNYRAESKNKASLDDFMHWLEVHGHNESKDLIESNYKTTISIKALLNQKSEIFTERFNQIDLILAKISSQVEGLDSLAEAIYPESRLSDQALKILSELDESGSSHFYILESADQPPLIDFCVGKGMYCDEERFMEADIESLVSAGFLTLRYNRGQQYYITREAVDYLKVIRERDKL